MDNSRPLKLVLGTLTLVPCAYLIYFLYGFFDPNGIATRAPEAFGGEPGVWEVNVRLKRIVLFLYAFLVFYYLRFLHRSSRIPSDKKGLWTLAVILGSVVTMPVFWAIHVWPNRPKS